MKHLLEVNNLSYAYHTLQGETLVLDHVNFSIEQGEFVAIVGPSGCGKSTLLSLICHLLEPDSGEIVLGDHKNRLHAPEGSSVRMAYNLQNIALGPEIACQSSLDLSQKIDTMLTNYQLDGFRNAKPNQLSGGMRQRAALIRTLMTEPDLLLLDEPFSALDYQTRLSVSDDVWDILKHEKKTALLITHDISEAISMADRIIILSARPATVKKEISVKLSCPGERTPFLSRSSPKFKDYFNLVWKELNHDE